MTRRTCARPGCGEPAVVVLGMDVSRRLAWFDAIDSAGSVAGAGRLCERHARNMVLPQGWFLDDRRVEFPQLFAAPGAKPATAPPPVPEPAADSAVEASEKPAPKPRKPRKKKVAPEPDLTGDQGSLLPEAAPATPDSAPVDPSAVASVVESPVVEPPVVEPPMASAALDDPVVDDADLADPTDGDLESWAPRFDQGDDLNGLLSAQTPLLSRAFGKKRRAG